MENVNRERLLLTGMSLPTEEAKLQQQQQALRVNLEMFKTASDALYGRLEELVGKRLWMKVGPHMKEGSWDATHIEDPKIQIAYLAWKRAQDGIDNTKKQLRAVKEQLSKL